MAYDTWANFKEYVSGSSLYKAHAKTFIEFFGNNGPASTAFKDRSLAWYNPVSNRYHFDCGYRMGCNVYSSCDHGCSYCYVNGYSNGVERGKRRPSFIKKLERDLEDFVRLGMPPGPVHMSNSTDPFQERLEKEFRDSCNMLRLFSKHADCFTEIMVLTKNPAFLLEPDYLAAIEALKDKIHIEITIPFYRNNYVSFEPRAPHPKVRLEVLGRLLALGFTVRVRIDPIFPRDSGIQTDADLVNILDACKGVQWVIAKPLRLIKPKPGKTSAFFDIMFPFYEGGKANGIEWHGGRYVYTPERWAKERAFLADQCSKRSIPLVHCKETVLIGPTGVPIAHTKCSQENEGKTV